MLCVLHQMAETYGMLPSRLLTEASTFDLVVFDVVTTYRAQQEQKKNRQPGQQQTTNIAGDDSMVDAVKRFRESV